MDLQIILGVLNRNYNIKIQKAELLREGGNFSYAVYGENSEYFLKVIRPPFLETALQSVDIQMYLLRSRFPVIPILLSKAGAPYIRAEVQGQECIFVLYDFIGGGEPNPEETEEVGALVGKLHRVMKSYTGRLPFRDKHFFIDRYIEILRRMQYPKSEFFDAYGNDLWERVKNLPRGYCHCDLYRGNIHRASGKAMYIVDFDTSCTAFPMYDVTLFCNDTHYFDFEDEGYAKSTVRLQKFLSGYLRHSQLSKEEISAFYDMIAVYHFQLQATMIEIYGYDFVSFDFLDKQYDWLLRWKEQCREASIM